MNSFIAIDFETADYGADSACAIGLVVVRKNKIVQRDLHLIRPPRASFYFTYLHGIEWRHVHKAPTFRELWPVIKQTLEAGDFVAAHNASFDKRVLTACCQMARIEVPDFRFVCSMELARRTWGLYPTRLPDVCNHLGIALNHHDPISDAEACARIIIAARNAGVLP
jgi:DNA polymerase-3 subunit epsilon